jgi:hypothetical protein
MTRVQRARKESLSHNTLIFRSYKCEKGKQEDEEEEEEGGGPHQEATYVGEEKASLPKTEGCSVRGNCAPDRSSVRTQNETLSATTTEKFQGFFFFGF